MEFITGASAIAVWQLGDKNSPMPHVQRLFIICMGFVVIPSTYVLNREVTKHIIVMENWCKGIKSVFMSEEELTPLVER